MFPDPFRRNTMKITQADAAKLLNVSGDLTPEIIKVAYRRACMKFHPDRGGSDEMMKAINQAYEVLEGFTGNIESSGEEGYPEALNDAINKIRHLDGIIIEICGAWVWVTGNTKQHKDALGKSGAGFFWASKKQAWYFRPDDWKSSGKGSFSLDEIRAKHGSQEVKKSYRQQLSA